MEEHLFKTHKDHPVNDGDHHKIYLYDEHSERQGEDCEEGKVESGPFLTVEPSTGEFAKRPRLYQETRCPFEVRCIQCDPGQVQTEKLQGSGPEGPEEGLCEVDPRVRRGG